MKSIKFCIALLLPALSVNALADSPGWTFIEGSYVSSDGESTELEFEPDGFEIAGSVAIGEWAFVDGSYSVETEGLDGGDLGFPGVDFDVDLDRLSIGVGAAIPLAENADVYGRLAFEEWTIEVEGSAPGVSASDELDENGYSSAVGVRAMVAEGLELRGEIGYIDIDELADETTFMAGAYYTFAPSITVGASFEMIDDFETYKATLRYQF